MRAASARARALVQVWGADTLALFVLRADKSYFFSEDERAFVAYRVVGGVAIVSGDPVGSPRALLALKGRFQLDNLLIFNRKFFPRRQRRFVVVERRRDLPRVGIAALAAESYLPFTGKK